MAFKKCLVLSSFMIPYVSNFGGSQRMYYLAQHLEHKGIDVTIMAYKGAKNKSFQFYEHDYKNIFLDGVMEYNQLLKKGSVADVCLKKIEKILFNEPNQHTGLSIDLWCKKYRGQIVTYILENNIDTVIISGPVFALFNMAPYIKKNANAVKVVLDYRDPWFLWNANRSIAYQKEKRNLHFADQVICFSKVFKNDMQKEFPREKDKFSVIYNGYVEDNWKDIDTTSKKHNKLRISYIGSISFEKDNDFRRPETLIDAFTSFSKDKPIELNFVGINRKDVKMMQMEKKSDGKIQFVEQVSHKESLHYMANSDVLIVMHQEEGTSGKYIVSGKFYDYMRSGRVIWNIGEESGLMNRFIQHYKLGITCTNNKVEIENVLNNLYMKWENNTLDLMRDTENNSFTLYSREIQNEKYYQLLSKG